MPRLQSLPPFPRRRALLAAAATIALPASRAQERWPTRPVRMIVPAAPGEPSDLHGRVLAERLARLWGHPVVVDNRPGSNGVPAMEALKAAPPDGATLGLATTGPLAINPSVFARPAYQPLKDFTLLARTYMAPLVLLVNRALPVHDVSELVALLKRDPGRLDFASAGAGTSQHLACELFKLATRTNATHVPYRGSEPALSELIAGQVQFMMDNVPSAFPHVRAGRVRALGVTSRSRNALLPQVPPLADSGAPGLANFEVLTWGGVLAPAGLPAALAQRIASDVAEVLREEAVVLRVQAMGAQVRPLAGAEFARFVGEEIARWASAARASGTRLG